MASSRPSTSIVSGGGLKIDVSTRARLSRRVVSRREREGDECDRVPGPGRRPWNGFLARLSSSRDAFAQREMTMDDLRPSDYAYRAIRRRFDDLDRGKKGYVEAEDMRAALARLNAPCTEASARAFVCRTIDACRVRESGGEEGGEGAMGEGREMRMTFEEFGNFALRRERELLRTFRKFDAERAGYLTSKQLKRVLMREGYATVSYTHLTLPTIPTV